MVALSQMILLGIWGMPSDKPRMTKTTQIPKYAEVQIPRSFSRKTWIFRLLDFGICATRPDLETKCQIHMRGRCLRGRLRGLRGPVHGLAPQNYELAGCEMRFPNPPKTHFAVSFWV